MMTTRDEDRLEAPSGHAPRWHPSPRAKYRGSACWTRPAMRRRRSAVYRLMRQRTTRNTSMRLVFGRRKYSGRSDGRSYFPVSTTGLRGFGR
jgi:hypothetical protein